MPATTDPDVIELLADLVRINSVNPNYDVGVPEIELANFVQAYFDQRDVETWRQEVYPDRPNIIVQLPGRNRNRRIVLEAHLDTVSTTGMTIEPHTPTIRDGKLYGRGSCDTKGGMAAMMHAVATLAREGITPPVDVLFTATIDEEFSYRGVVALCNSLKPGDVDPAVLTDAAIPTEPLQAVAAIIAEPTNLRAVIASKGLVRWKIETVGKSAHSAKPHLGINAIEQMAVIIAALKEDTRLMAKHTHPLLGPATCNIGIIRGGVQINFVPDRCEIEIDRRLLPGETPESVLDYYQDLVNNVSGTDSSMQVVMHPPMLKDRPLETPADSLAVKTMQHVLQAMNLNDEAIGVPFCSDASKFGALGIPSMIFGPGSIDQAHAAVEFVDCHEVQQATEVIRQYILNFPEAT